MMVSNAIMPDQLGGLQRYVHELARAVGRSGVPVTILVKRTSPELPSEEALGDGVLVRRYDIPSRTNPTYAAAYPIASFRAVARAVGSFAGVVHVHYPLQGFAPAVLGARYVHTFHAPIYRELLPEHQDRYRLPSALRGALVTAARLGESTVARRAEVPIVLTEFMRSELSVLAPAAAERAALIPAGLNSEFFSPGSPIAHQAAGDGEPLLFTARRLVPRTGVTELVQAMPAVLAVLPGAQLAIAGDGPLRTEIAAMIAGLGLGGSVTLLGRVSDEELRGWYRAASLFVLPTQELEGFGMSTIEALACGTPAIGTPVGGTPEVLGSLDSRLIAPGTSAEALARGVVELLLPDGLLASIAERARAHVVPRMSWSTIADRHFDVYERAAFAGAPR